MRRLLSSVSRLLQSLAAVILAAVCANAECPPEGSATTQRLQLSNIFKNRDLLPVRINQDVSLRAMLWPGDDTDRWSNFQAASITGYIVAVERGSVESCNCKATDVDEQDTHIALALSPTEQDNRRYVIAEVTPRIRKAMRTHGIDWSTAALRKLRGKEVTITGWLFYDREHWQNAFNTNPNGGNIWRATAFEIHPIASIKLK